jgi:hypothetical protein
MHNGMDLGQESIWLDFQSSTKSNGYYNISLAINASAPQSLDKLLMGPINNTDGSIIKSKGGVNGLSIYLNGTVVDMAVDLSKQLNYHLNSGDCVQVNFTLPCSEYASNSTMGVVVFTSKETYGTETVLP